MNSITFSRTIKVPYGMCERCEMFEPKRSKFFDIDTRRRADDIGCEHEQTCKELVKTIEENGLVDADGTNYKISATQPKSSHEVDKEQENAVMSPEEFKKEAMKIQNIKECQFGDKHRIADDLMEELLESLGYEAGLNIIRKLPRYYT